jgi:hypothetical protein
MRLLNHVSSHQQTRKIELRYDPEQLSATYDKRVRTNQSKVLDSDGTDILIPKEVNKQH